MGVITQPSGKEASGVRFYPRAVFAPVQFVSPAVVPAAHTALLGRAISRACRGALARRRRRVSRERVYSAGHAVDLPGPGVSSGPFVSRSGRPLDCLSGGPGAAAV